MKAPLRAVLFDLDGTLIDTAPDFALVLNRMRTRRQFAPLPYQAVRQVVSDGARALVTLGFGVSEGEAGFEPLREELLALYSQHLAEQSTLFAGMDEVLRSLEQQGTAWGIVTNKPVLYARPLLQALGLAERCATLICPDHVAQRKPNPEGLQLACQQIGCDIEQALYVGDHRRDIEAGKNAGMATVACAYGYIHDSDDPAQWGADQVIEHAGELLEWLLARHTAA